MIIDLNEKAPHIDVKFGSKTYQIFANDENQEVLNSFGVLYTKYQTKSNEIAKRFEATEKGEETDNPLTPEDYQRFVNDLTQDTKDVVTNDFDILLGEDGIGEELWRAQNNSSEYLGYLLIQIQSALEAEQNKFEKKKEDQFKQTYPTHKAQNRAERRSKNTNKK